MHKLVNTMHDIHSRHVELLARFTYIVYLCIRVDHFIRLFFIYFWHLKIVCEMTKKNPSETFTT